MYEVGKKLKNVLRSETSKTTKFAKKDNVVV